MRSTLGITLINTVFWFALHFGIAELLTSLPTETQRRLFDWNRPFFRVSEREMAFYRRIRLPRWKDRLPSSTRSSISVIWLFPLLLLICGSFWKSPATPK